MEALKLFRGRIDHNLFEEARSLTFKGYPRVSIGVEDKYYKIRRLTVIRNQKNLMSERGRLREITYLPCKD